MSNSTEPKKTTLNEIRDELLRQVPDYAHNPYFKKKWSLRLLDLILRHCKALAMKLIPVYVRKTNQVV